MALLRVIGLAALAACSSAGADPRTASGVQVPSEWRALPELASGVRTAAAAGGITIEGAEAWGETAMGCYAVWLRLHGPGATSEQVLRGLAEAKLELRDVVKPDAGEDGLVSVTFERAPYRGRLRVRVATPAITALTCFANEREPAACERACTLLLGALP